VLRPQLLAPRLSSSLCLLVGFAVSYPPARLEHDLKLHPLSEQQCSERHTCRCPNLRGPTPTRRCCGRAREVEFTGISFYCIEGGKIAESWTVEDQFGLMRQIGAIPEPGQSEGASPA
jgi:SnoaL-like polyketide cyclase